MRRNTTPAPEYRYPRINDASTPSSGRTVSVREWWGLASFAKLKATDTGGCEHPRSVKVKTSAGDTAPKNRRPYRTHTLVVSRLMKMAPDPRGPQGLCQTFPFHSGPRPRRRDDSRPRRVKHHVATDSILSIRTKTGRREVRQFSITLSHATGPIAKETCHGTSIAL